MSKTYRKPRSIDMRKPSRKKGERVKIRQELAQKTGKITVKAQKDVINEENWDD